MSVVEFSPRVRVASITPFGASSDRKSLHLFDQVQLYSQRRLKPAWLYEDDVLSHTKRAYRPGIRAGGE